MRQEVLTRFRNAFAGLVLELLNEPPSPSVESGFALPFSSMIEGDWRKAVQLWREHSAELLAALPVRPCPACGSSASRWLFESYDAHQFHECRECGCWFTPKVVEWDVFERLFERSPAAAAHASHMMSERADAVRETDMARIGSYLDDLLPLIPRHEGRPIAYLDAGCGVGHSLRAGLERGLNVQGVEVDGSAVVLARQAGLPVAFPAEIDAMPAGPYQLLTFWETLEHISAPLETLQRFVPFLAVDGLLAITVPNLNAPATRAMREACVWVHGGYNTPGHVNLFHAHAIERLLARAGLTLLDAEGQFSSNALELLAFMGGESRGAFDVLDPTLHRGHLPAYVGALLEDVWPGMELLEQIALASPILRVVACRRGQESRFAEMFAARREQRRMQLAAEARRLMEYEVDYEARSERLQEEVNRRDDLLREKDHQMQSEVQRRDDLLRDNERHLQGEIQLRDERLADLQAKWDGRFVARVGRAFGRLTRR